MIDRLAGGEVGVVGGRLEALAERRQGRVGDVLDVAARRVRGLDLARVGVEGDDLVAASAKATASGRPT